VAGALEGSSGACWGFGQIHCFVTDSESVSISVSAAVCRQTERWSLFGLKLANIGAYKYADKLRRLIIRPIDSIVKAISLEIYSKMVNIPSAGCPSHRITLTLYIPPHYRNFS